MTTESGRPATGPAVTPREVGEGRYRLDATVSPHRGEGLWAGHDRRLSRAVLVQCHAEPPRQAPAAHRLASAPYPAVAPVLDAGHDRRPDGTWHGFTVFPATGWLPAADLPASPGVVTADLAAVAAWLVAAGEHVRSVCGMTVALGIDHVVVDPRLPTGALPAGECPVQWMPAIGSARADALPELLDLLGTGVERRARRRFAAAIDASATAQGRRRAARTFAALAGIDPLGLHLPPVNAHHAGTGRRSFDRRSPAGNLPAMKRRELPCVSAEASS